MTTTRTTTREAARLFRALLSSTQTADAWQRVETEMARLYREAPADSVARDVFAENAERARDHVREFHDDADHLRELILAAGLTPDQYEAWTRVAV